MGNIAEELQRIITAKSNIKQAIEDKGVTVGDTKIDGYAELISLISGGSPDTPIIQYEEYIPRKYTVLDHSDYYGSNGTTGNSFPPYLAFDHDMTTRALLLSTDKNFYITFSIDKKIIPGKLKIAQGFYQYRYVTSAKIYGLNDNNEYELITTYSDFAENKTLLSEASGFDIIIFNTDKKYDTYKIEFVGQTHLDRFITGQYAIQLWEIELSGLIKNPIIQEDKTLEFYEYLQGNGDSYIRTDILVNNNTCIEFDLDLDKVPDDAHDFFVIGCRKAYTDLEFSFTIAHNTKNYKYRNKKQDFISTTGYTKNAMTFNIKILTRYCFFNGNYLKTYTNTSDTYTFPLFIFNLNNNGNIVDTSYTYNGRFGTIRIYESNKIKNNLRPCLYYGEAGFYDTINNKFYSSYTDTPFTVAGNVLP